MAMVLACASMQFSTNSAIALSGLLCERAMIRIAFQSSPIRSLPPSDSSGLALLLFAIVTRIRRVACNSGTSGLSLHQDTHYTDGLQAGQGAALLHQLYQLGLRLPERLKSLSKYSVDFATAQTHSERVMRFFDRVTTNFG